MIKFRDVASQVGLDNYEGESWGAAWGDINGDGRPDLWVNNHVGAPNLYLNQVNGQFRDVTADIVRPQISQDYHGALFADIDNDGDQDLLQLTGAGGGVGGFRSFIFLNEAGLLIDRSESVGLDYPLGRGRMPLLFDQNQDGRLDVLFSAASRPDGQAPTTLFQQTDNGFVDIGEQVGLTIDNGEFAQLVPLTGASLPEVLVIARKQRLAFDYSQSPLVDVSASVNTNLLISGDFAIADLNGDLQLDIFQVTKGSAAESFQDLPNSFKTFYKIADLQNRIQGHDFSVPGNVTFNFPTLKKTEIFIGQEGVNPDLKQFRLSPNAAQGLADFDPDQDEGVYIGYDSATQRWQIRWVGPLAREVYGRITASNRISPLTPIGFNNNRNFRLDRLLLNGKTGLRREEGRGLTERTAGSGVVIGDYDNDMDEDIFIVSGTKIGNPGDVLYENLGQGQFREVGLEAGIRGTSRGVGASALQADYNLDGFLDILVLNGPSFLGLSRPIVAEEGPHALWLNQANGNHWLQVDLEGRLSNRDGIGTSVIANAGGVAQLRFQSGGGQKQVQNHTRLHFGLAEHDQVDSLVVKWPSGTTQTLRTIAADQVLKVIEGVGSIGRDALNGTSGPDRLAGLSGPDVLRGFAGNDTLLGQVGDDLILAGSGNDLITGGAGRDQIKTGNGRDSVRYLNPFEGVDTIQDFSALTDRILVRGEKFRGQLELGVLERSRFVRGGAALNPTDRFIYNRQTGELFFDRNGSLEGGTGEILLATFTNKPDLRANNIIVF